MDDTERCSYLYDYLGHCQQLARDYDNEFTRRELRLIELYRSKLKDGSTSQLLFIQVKLLRRELNSRISYLFAS